MSACIFCEIVAGRAPDHRVYEQGSFLAFLDIYPVRLFERGTRIAAAIRRSELGGGDINFVVNDGPMANQTVPHVHLHLVPRQPGDIGKLARMLLQRPVQALLGQAPSARLEAQARAIRESM